MWRPYGCYHNYYTGSALNHCFVRRVRPRTDSPSRWKNAAAVDCVNSTISNVSSARPPPLISHFAMALQSAPCPLQSKLQRVKFIGESTLGESFAQFQIHLNKSNYYWPEKQTVHETKVARPLRAQQETTGSCWDATCAG